jgi:hypothetical protein
MFLNTLTRKKKKSSKSLHVASQRTVSEEVIVYHSHIKFQLFQHFLPKLIHVTGECEREVKYLIEIDKKEC